MNLRFPGYDEDIILDKSRRAVFVYGKNGTGKSSLLARWALYNKPSVYLNADRTSRVSIGAVSASELDKRRRRFTGHGGSEEGLTAPFPQSSQGTQLYFALVKLIRNRYDDLEKLRKKELPDDHPIVEDKINEILSRIGLRVSLEFDTNEDCGFRTKRDSLPRYSVTECSDGERAAMLIVCETLLAEPGSLIVIDEPDKHLYDEIVLPLLSEIVGLRTDCYFAVCSAMNLADDAWRRGVVLDTNWSDVELVDYDKRSDTWTTRQ